MRKLLVGLAVLTLALSACSRNSGDDTTTTAESGDTTTTTVAGGQDDATSTTGTSATSSTTTSTTSTSSTTTTTRATTTTTTTTIPADNLPPVVEITSPAALSAHAAAYDASRADFGAVITFTASASDPNGDTVEVEWYASGTGFLGRGESISAWVSTLGSDASQPVIEARAIDRWGTRSSDTIQIIVWIPSDI